MTGAQPGAPRGAPLAPVAEKFAGIRRIAVLRGGGIGDLLLALPAIKALEAAYPGVHITVLGSPWAHVLTGQPGAPQAVETLPIHAGVHEVAGSEEDPAATEHFFERMRHRRFDLAVQLHGGGRFSNPFLLRLNATHTVGTGTPDATPLERTLPYALYQHEMLRSLEVVGLAGAAPVTLEPRLVVPPAVRTTILPLVDREARGLVLVHPGATDPRRRWPAGRFAQIAVALAQGGAQVIVVGDDSDRLSAAEILRTASALPNAKVSSVAGDLSLLQFAALAERADVMLGNDSGPRHVAAAVGTATVSIYWCGNLINAGPLDRGRHRVHLSWTTRCPVCGRDCTQVGWTAPRCEHDVSFVADVPIEPVLADVTELLAASVEGSARLALSGTDQA